MGSTTTTTTLSRNNHYGLPRIRLRLALAAVVFCGAIVNLRLDAVYMQTAHVLANEDDDDDGYQQPVGVGARKLVARKLSMADFTNIQKEMGFGYSGMWWLNREQFLRIDVEKINYLEAASFQPFEMVGLDKVLLPRDWLDFSVEHLSRYFRSIDYTKDLTTFRRMVKLLKNYREKVRSQHYGAQRTASAHTIAILPFYTDPNDARLTQRLFEHYIPKVKARHALLDLFSLAATLLSLWQMGIPRAVVVGNAKAMPLQVKRAFRLCSNALAAIHQDERSENKVLGMSLEYVQAQNILKNEEENSDSEIVMPRYAIENLQQAMLDKVSSAKAKAILGNDPSRWQYVYFTEPDLLVHTRASALPALTKRLQEGFLLSAVRLFPLPHVIDFPNHKWPGELVPNNVRNLSVFYDLHPDTDSCCYVEDWQPGRQDYPPTNDTCAPAAWYRCDLHDHSLLGGTEAANLTQQHRRLDKYPLIRLVKGLGTPLVNEHARLCRPSKLGSCRQPDASPQ